jgi:putative membrane protein
VPFIGLAAAQGALVILGVLLLRVQPAHTLAFVALISAAAVSFALLHQGLTALTGSFAWVVSVALLALQVLAAGVILPSIFVPDWVLGLGHVLPLSQAIMGAQEAITGGSLAGIANSVVWLLVASVIGILLTLGAVARGRKVTVY